MQLRVWIMPFRFGVCSFVIWQFQRFPRWYPPFPKAQVFFAFLQVRMWQTGCVPTRGTSSKTSPHCRVKFSFVLNRRESKFGIPWISSLNQIVSCGFRDIKCPPLVNLFSTRRRYRVVGHLMLHNRDTQILNP